MVKKTTEPLLTINAVGEEELLERINEAGKLVRPILDAIFKEKVADGLKQETLLPLAFVSTAVVIALAFSEHANKAPLDKERAERLEDTLQTSLKTVYWHRYNTVHQGGRFH